MWDFTEELAQGIALAQGQGKRIGRVHESVEKGTGPGSCCHVGTSSAAQEGPVVQGFAEGHVVVVAHDGEEGNLYSHEEDKQKHLSSTC